MPELSVRDERPPPDWPVCSRYDDDGCIGIRIGTTAYCLGHLERQDPEELKEFLAALKPGASLDLRGTQLSAQLLDQLLSALKNQQQSPTIEQARFDQAQFSGHARFGGVHFSGTAWFQGVQFNWGAEFGGARFSGPAGFEGAQFNGNAWFDGAQFSGDARFDEARFSRTARFVRVQFSERALFPEAQFRGTAAFGRAQFSGNAQFDRTQFKGHAKFVGAQFIGEARFAGVLFSEGAGFEGTQFSGPAGFEEARFNGGAGFAEAQFNGRTEFTKARFSESVEFGEAQFGGDVGFGESQFTETVGFEMVQFNGFAWFESTQFREDVLFDRARFNGDVWFDQTQFNETAWFIGAHFTAPTKVGPICADVVVLDGASFGASVVVEVAAGRLSMVGTRFEQEADLRVRYADVVLDGAAFAKPASLAFAEAPFLVQPSRTDQQPAAEEPPRPPASHSMRPTLDETPLKQGDSQSRPRLLSMRRVDVTHLVLADVDLAWCLFRGAHNLDKLRIEGPKHFATTPRGWTERRTLVEERIWRQTRYPHQDWRLPSAEGLQWVAEQSRQPIQPADPDHVAPLYRALRKAEEDAKYEPGAADFYYGEMEMRRHADGTPWVEKRLLWAYWLVAGYGLRGLRALTSLLVVVFGLAVLLQWVGFRDHPLAAHYWDSVLFAAKSTLSLPVQEQLTGWGEVLRILLRLTGPVLLGLALLSVRGRVKR